MNLRSLVARHHKSYNDRDLDAMRNVFDEDVEIVVDGSALHGVDAALGYATATFREFPRLHIQDERVVAVSGDTIVTEHQIVNGDPSGGPLRPQGSVCEIYRVRDKRIFSYTCYYAPEGPDREDVVNVPSRAEGSKMAEEQAALRRVATLVARGVSQDELFAAVNEEVGWLVGADPTSLVRFEADDTVTLVAAWSAAEAGLPIGARRPVGDELRSMRDDGRAWRFGPIELPHEGPFVEEARQRAIRSAVGVPIVVDGRVWGAAFAASTREEPFPNGTETRLAQFTELVATAIANTEARTELAASRARIVAATDDERRRVVRDLHDGAQQRLVHTIITLKMAQRAMQNDEDAPALLSEALDHAEHATIELRELAHGILPAALTQGGLRAGVDALGSRSPVPVAIDVSVGRLPAAVEATAYFVVAEALTNVAKHAQAGHAEVTARIEHGTLAVQVRDDGAGGAARRDGRGLTGLADRVAAVDGELRVESPADGGTLVAATIPLPD